MDTSEKTAGQEWREGWRLVLACSLAVSWVAAPTTSLTLFIEPLQKAFGWGRGDISAGLFVYSIVSVFLVPFAGALADKYGTRTIALPGLLLNGLAYAAFGLMTPSLWHWFAAWVLYTITQLMIGTYIWNGAVSAAFARSRGLAIAVVMGGIAIGQFVAPLLVRPLLEHFGWRAAFGTLGIGWTCIACLVAIFFFHDPRGRGSARAQASGAMAAVSKGGLTFAEALSSVRFLRIALAILLQGLVVSGVLVHLVPLLRSAQVSLAEATTMVALTGVAAWLGQLVTGWLADRVTSTVVPVSCFLLPALAYAILLHAQGSLGAFWAAAMLAGFASGACINITTYLTSRYVGLDHFGKIYGVISSCMRVGAGFGPFIAGMVFDRTGSYDAYLTFGIVLACLASLAVFRLGSYPTFTPVQPGDSQPVGDTVAEA